jgi:hypothetical protein
LLIDISTMRLLRNQLITAYLAVLRRHDGERLIKLIISTPHYSCLLGRLCAAQSLDEHFKEKEAVAEVLIPGPR